MAEPLVEGQLTGFVGWWRIVEMELWDADVIDLVAPAFIEFGKDLRGRFGFVVVDGWMDCRMVERCPTSPPMSARHPMPVRKRAAREWRRSENWSYF